MAETYKIGIEMALVGTLPQALEAIAGKLLGIHGKIKDIEGGFLRWGLAVGGAASIFASDVIVKGLEKVVDAGGELVKQQTLLGNMGFSQRDIWATTAAAQQASQKILGTTIAENIKGIRELVGVMPNLKEAQSVYVPVMRAAKVLESMTGAPADQSMQVLAKAIELRGGGIDPKTGQLDPERFVKEAEAATKAIIASGGLANARQLLNAMQQAGPMARMMTDPAAFYKTILTALMDMSGFRAGTALTAIGRQLLGGKMSTSTAEEMERMGLLPPGSWHKSGAGAFVKPNSLLGMDLLQGDGASVGKWFNDVLLPQFALKGITSSTDIQQELYRLFGTETARRLAGLFIQNKAQITRDSTLYDNALGGQSYDNIAGGGKDGGGDYTMNVDNLHKAVQNFLEAFGAPMVPAAISALQSISGVVNSIAGLELAHPRRMKMIGEGLAGVAAGMAVLGGAAVVSAAAMLIPGGLIAVAIVGLTAAATAITAINWGAVTDATSKMKDWFVNLLPSADQIHGITKKIDDSSAAFLNGIVSSMKSAIESIPGALVGAIQGMAAGIVSAMGRALESLGGAFNKSGPGDTSPNPFSVTPNSYRPVPPVPRSGAQSASAGHVYLDGAKVGSVLWNRELRSGGHPTSAPLFDAHNAFVSTDYGFQTG